MKGEIEMGGNYMEWRRFGSWADDGF